MKTFDNFTDEQVESALAGAYAVYRSDWSRGPMVRRLQVLSRPAERIDERAEELARIITLEMGKRIGEARAARWRSSPGSRGSTRRIPRRADGAGADPVDVT